MENKIIAKRIFDFHKSTFDSTFNSLTILQQQMEKMFLEFVQRSAWFPAEGKAAINEWGNMCEKGRCDFKEAIENSFKQWEEYFAAGESAFSGEADAAVKADKTKMSKATI
ncbi:MAG: hypothetical protein ABRQ34_11055 [Smithellaceae bacterium]